MDSLQILPGGISGLGEADFAAVGLRRGWDPNTGEGKPAGHDVVICSGLEGTGG